MDKHFFKVLKSLILCLDTVFKHSVKQRENLEYSQEQRELSENFRGRIVQVTDNNGKILCIGCGICQKVCPCKNLINIKKEKNEISGDEEIIYERDDSQCIYCGNCVENCPVHALTFSKEYDFAESDKASFRKVYKNG